MEISEALQKIPMLAAFGAQELETSPLTGGLTNDNYKVSHGNERFVLRIPGRGSNQLVDRAKEKHAAALASKAGINAEVFFFDESSGLQLCRFVDGKTLSIADFQDDAILARAVSSMRTIHKLTEPFTMTFSYSREIDRFLDLLSKVDVRLPEGFSTELSRVRAYLDWLETLAIEHRPCHCDPLPENFLDTGKQVYLIDWEYSGNADPLLDLGGFARESNFDQKRIQLLLKLYFKRDPTDEEVRRTFLYGVVADFAWYIWALYKSGVDRGDFDYVEYGQNRYQRFLAESTSISQS